MSSTLGAPGGAFVSGIVPGFESSYVRQILASVKSCSGRGNTSPPPLAAGGRCWVVPAEPTASAATSRSDGRWSFMPGSSAALFQVESHLLDRAGEGERRLVGEVHRRAHVLADVETLRDAERRGDRAR